MVDRSPAGRGGRRVRLAILGLILVLIFSISTVVGLYADLLWYQEIGLASVFWTILGSQALLAGASGLVFFVFMLANLTVVARLMPLHRLAIDPEDPLQRYRAAFLPYIRWFAIGGSAFLAALFGIGVTPLWNRFVLALNAVPFGVKDQVFSLDVGFYVFKLPLYRFIYSWSFSALVVVIVVVATAHYLTGGIRPQGSGDRVTPQVKAHLSVLIGLLALLRAWGYRLNQFDLLYSTRGDVTGASYTDLNAELPALKLLVVISVIGAGLFLVNIRFRGWALPLAGAGLWLLTSLLAAGVYPFVIQRFVVAPAQLQRERAFIQRNIEATRRAYGLDTILVREYPARSDPSRDDIDGNPGTIDNVRLWDTVNLMAAYRQLQEIRPYYQFHDVDVDRYLVDGRLRQVLLSARELDNEFLSTQNWQNTHILYTHGYGAVASFSNEATTEGQPSFLVQDIPPQSQHEVLRVTQPGIYFGEGQAGIYSLVRTEQQELDFGLPGGTSFTTYEGKGGVRLSGIGRRLAFAWHFRNINLLISNLITGESRILYDRQIHERLQKAAPFLDFDTDPYFAIVDGRVVWIADAYTSTSMYPYSERVDFASRTRRTTPIGTLSGIPGVHNYVRNSVKATVDAFDGTVNFYVWDETDPIIKAWRKAFPDQFKDIAAMPAEIRSHVRYPEDLFRIQTFVYKRYHMTDPTDLFSGEDVWDIPNDPNADNAAGTGGEFQPYYVLMRLPDAEQEEYVLILPMNPRNKRNMVSWIAVRAGPSNYGELIDFRFPKGEQVDGVGQVHARINADPIISQAITLLSQRGSNVVFGNLLVIPIEGSLLYLQPLLVQAERNAIPELKRVILATGTRVVMGSSLDEALDLLLGGGKLPPGEIPDGLVPPQSSVGVEAAREALQHLQAAEEAARIGDWATYGREQQLARQALERALSGNP